MHARCTRSTKAKGASMGQHNASDAVQEKLQEREVLLAFHDDICVVTPNPTRVGPIYAVLQEHLHAHANIRGVEPWCDETSSLRRA